MNNETLSWCAGIFEADGHGRVQNIKNHYYAHIEIDMTIVSILRRFKEIVGVGSVLPHNPKRKDGRKRKPSFRYSVTCVKAYKVAQLLLPFIVSDYKRNQLLKILKYQKI